MLQPMPLWWPSAELTVYQHLSDVGGPKLYLVFQVQSNTCWAEESHHPPRSAGCDPTNTAQDAAGLFYRQGQLLAHIQPAVCQDPSVHLSRAAPQPGSLWPVMLQTPQILWYQFCGDGQDTLPMPHKTEAPRYPKIICNSKPGLTS